jgi:hypothetical protein
MWDEVMEMTRLASLVTALSLLGVMVAVASRSESPRRFFLLRARARAAPQGLAGASKLPRTDAVLHDRRVPASRRCRCCLRRPSRRRP